MKIITKKNIKIVVLYVLIVSSITIISYNMSKKNIRNYVDEEYYFEYAMNSEQTEIVSEDEPQFVLASIGQPVTLNDITYNIDFISVEDSNSLSNDNEYYKIELNIINDSYYNYNYNIDDFKIDYDDGELYSSNSFYLFDMFADNYGGVAPQGQVTRTFEIYKKDNFDSMEFIIYPEGISSASRITYDVTQDYLDKVLGDKQ